MRKSISLSLIVTFFIILFGLVSVSGCTTNDPNPSAEVILFDFTGDEIGSHMFPASLTAGCGWYPHLLNFGGNNFGFKDTQFSFTSSYIYNGHNISENGFNDGLQYLRTIWHNNTAASFFGLFNGKLVYLSYDYPNTNATIYVINKTTNKVEQFFQFNFTDYFENVLPQGDNIYTINDYSYVIGNISYHHKMKSRYFFYLYENGNVLFSQLTENITTSDQLDYRLLNVNKTIKVLNLSNPDIITHSINDNFSLYNSEYVQSFPSLLTENNDIYTIKQINHSIIISNYNTESEFSFKVNQSRIYEFERIIDNKVYYKSYDRYLLDQLKRNITLNYYDLEIGIISSLHKETLENYVPGEVLILDDYIAIARVLPILFSPEMQFYIALPLFVIIFVIYKMKKK